jgi:hypothetical protein
VGYLLAPEGARHRIAHRAGVVTSQMSERADWDNGAQFMIITGVDLDLDKRHTPFAKVVEGMGVIDRIGQRKTAAKHPTYKDDAEFSAVLTRDLLVEPVTIHKVIVYENGKPLEHDFPLDDAEKSLGGLSQFPVKPLTGDALYGGRRLCVPGSQTEERRLGLDIPFPDDVDAGKADPLGARIVPK